MVTDKNIKRLTEEMVPGTLVLTIWRGYLCLSVTEKQVEFLTFKISCPLKIAPDSSLMNVKSYGRFFILAKEDIVIFQNESEQR